MALNKIPSGVKTLDTNINDGFPAGSVILLLEDVGAGAREFIYTSIVNNINLKADPSYFEMIKRKHKKQSHEGEINTTLVLPDEIYYISLSRSKEDILNENAYAFHEAFYNTLKEGVNFKELSDIYFRQSIIKNLWLINNKKNLDFENNSNKNILEVISDIFVDFAANNIVILDSLTELMLYEGDYLSKNDVIMFIKSLVRISKEWNGLIYLLLNTRILETNIQEIISDTVDGVLTFEWDKRSVKLQRNLCITKFRGLLPQLEQNNIEKFETKITSNDGFEVSNIRKII